MTFKKLLIVCLCILLKTTSFVHANERIGDDRQMQRQYHKAMSKHQKFLDLQTPTKPFTFVPTPTFRWDTRKGQALLTFGILTCVLGMANGMDVKGSPSHGGGGHLDSGSHPQECVDTPTGPVCTPHAVGINNPSAFGVANSVAAGGGNQMLLSATASALEKIFCPDVSPSTNPGTNSGQGTKKPATLHCVQISDDEVTFTGTKEVLDAVQEKLEDFTILREKVIPTSPEAAKTQAHPGLQLTQWSDVEKSLGVNPEDLKNMAISECDDCGDCAAKLGIDPDKIKDQEFCNTEGTNKFRVLSYKPSETIAVKSFNQKTADAYLETLKEESLFFRFMADKNRNLVTSAEGYIFINYGNFNDYFSRLPLQIRAHNGVLSTTVPLSHILKRLMAAVSGGVSLEKTSVPGAYHVRTTTLEDTRSLEEKKFTPPLIESFIDRSGSMQGEPIETINKKFPGLLQKFKNALKKDQHLNVNIHALDDKFELSQSFSLDGNYDPSQWKMIEIRGGTDLSPIGKLLEIKPGENPSKVVVGFTDGEHVNGPPLNAAYYGLLENLRASGSFARVFLCKVGSGTQDGSKPDEFFKNIAKIFEGSYSETDTIDDCIQRIADEIPSLLESKEPLVLTIDGNNMVVWQQNAQAGIQTTTQTVRSGDVVTHGRYKATVQVETKEQKKARLKAELEALETD